MTATNTQQNRAAPGELALVQALVNTRYGRGLRAHAEVTNPEQLCGWLVAYGLLSEGTPVTAGDLRRFQELREALRDLLRANSHAQVNAEQISTLNHLASNSPLKVHFHGNAQVALVPDIGGVDGALARILGIVFSAMQDHSWSRLKACRNERCQKAFYDTSKNHSGTWCAMSGCGSRIKARAYRQRRNEVPARAAAVNGSSHH